MRLKQIDVNLQYCQAEDTSMGWCGGGDGEVGGGCLGGGRGEARGGGGGGGAGRSVSLRC